MSIKVLITGGTIDNLEYDTEDKAPKNQKTIIPDLLKKSRISLGYNVEEVCFKDSRFVMTMPITTKYLGKNRLPKTIVLLGSTSSTWCVCNNEWKNIFMG